MIVSKLNFYLVISYYDDYHINTDDNYDIIFNQMLSTFKFIETDKTADWQTYKNEKIDVSFKYPTDWVLKEVEEEKNGIFSLYFSNTGLDDGSLAFIGINNQYVDEGPNHWLGYCAVLYKNIDDFCRGTCRKINKNTAVDYRWVFHGEGTFSALAYTKVSKKYPSICLEYMLDQLVVEKAKKENIDYFEVPKKYDLKSLIENREASSQVLNVIDTFEKIAGSINIIVE